MLGDPNFNRGILIYTLNNRLRFTFLVISYAWVQGREIHEREGLSFLRGNQIYFRIIMKFLLAKSCRWVLDILETVKCFLIFFSHFFSSFSYLFFLLVFFPLFSILFCFFLFSVVGGSFFSAFIFFLIIFALIDSRWWPVFFRGIYSVYGEYGRYHRKQRWRRRRRTKTSI